MKALIRKYPVNTDAEYKSEVILEPWPECIAKDIDDWLDNYHYALCENVPEHPIELLEIDQRTNVNNYRVEAYDHKGRARYRAVWAWS